MFLENGNQNAEQCGKENSSISCCHKGLFLGKIKVEEWHFLTEGIRHDMQKAKAT